MNEERRGPWYLVTGALIGLALGVIYSWGIAPVQYTDTSPGTLRADFKDQYRYMIASAYRLNPDLARAQARLSLLNDPDPMQALNAQAQQMRADGAPDQELQALTLLSDALNAIIPTPTVTPSPLPPSPTVPTAIVSPTVFRTAPPTRRPTQTTTPTITLTPTATFTPISTATPRATRTPTRTPGAPFVLKARAQICNADQPALMQIYLTDSSGKPAPGIEIVVLWNTFEEHIFTGLKSELGNGYADFVMSSGVIYTLRVGESGNALTDLIAPLCAAPDGSSFTGGWKLEFQQP
jgi:hypothetical protein